MLTTSGLGAMITAASLAVLGWWWGYEELWVAAAAIAVVVLLAVWVARRPLNGKVSRRITALRVPRGDEIHVVYRVRNNSRRRTGRATIVDRCDDATTRTFVTPVGANSVGDFFGTLPTRRRGVFDVGPFEVERIDPFFLALGTRHHTDTISVTIHPKVYDLIGPQGAVRVVDSESIWRRRTNDPMSGFVSMREYVAGDDPRLIHWPTTARTGSLMVREHVEVRRPEFTVVLDASEQTCTPADFEEMVDVVASLAAHAIRTGLDVVVRTTSNAFAGTSVPITDEGTVLDFLTPVERVAHDELMNISSLFIGGFDHTSIVMVTGPTGPSSRFASHERMLVVRVGDGAIATTGVAVAAANATEFVQRWRTRA